MRAEGAVRGRLGQRAVAERALGSGRGKPSEKAERLPKQLGKDGEAADVEVVFEVRR